MPAPIKWTSRLRRVLLQRLEQGLSIRNIAAELGMDPKSVRRYMREQGIAPLVKHAGVTEEEMREIKMLSDRGLSTYKIADIMGKNRSLIYTKLRQMRDAEAPEPEPEPAKPGLYQVEPGNYWDRVWYSISPHNKRTDQNAFYKTSV